MRPYWLFEDLFFVQQVHFRTEEQAHQDQSLPEGKKIGPLTQKEWAENWDIWYDTMLGSPPSVHVVKRFEGAENYQLAKGQVAAQIGTALSLSVIKRTEGPGDEPGVLRFTEEVSEEYESILITLPDNDIVIFTKIQRTE